MNNQIEFALEQKLPFLGEPLSVEVIGSADPFPFEGILHEENKWADPFERCSPSSDPKDNACLAVERARTVDRIVTDWLSSKEIISVTSKELFVRQDPFLTTEFERLGDCLHGKIVNGMSLLDRARTAKTALLGIDDTATVVTRPFSESRLRGCSVESSSNPCEFAIEIGVEKGNALVEWMAPFRSVIVLLSSR